MSKHKAQQNDQDLEDLNFLKSFAVHNISANLTLEEEERAANALLRGAFAKSKQFQEEHKYELPDHLEQFRLGYEKADHKALGRIPMVSTLSPRTRRELSLLPPPNTFEEQKIKKFVEMSGKANKSNLYGNLAQQHQPDAAPRLSSIVNSHMVLIPNNASKEVERASTNYFETMEHAKMRKQEQDAKLAKLFDKYKDAATDEPTKATAKNIHKQATLPSPKKQRTLPRLSMAPVPAPGGVSTTAERAENASTHSGSSVASLQPTASKTAGAPARSGFSLSKSLSSLTLNPRLKSPDKSHRPTSVESKVPSPSKIAAAATSHMQAAQENDAETLLQENTPLLYSMFKANPLAERGVRYSQATMTSILTEKYTQESERLQRITAKLQQKSEQEYLNLFSVKVLEECGLDLNKEFNKIRNYTIYLMQLSYHFYIQRMRAGFTHLHAQFSKIKAARIAHATKIVYRSIKLGVYMMTTNERKRRKIAQDRAEALRLLEIDAKRRKMAGRIFRAMYLYKQMKRIRRLLRSRRAATIIQKRARGIRGRRIAREWKELKAKLSRSALCIQCGYRCHLARRKVTLTRKLHVVKLLLDELQRFRVGRLQQMRLDGAETYIAKAYRTLVIRRKLKNLLYWNRYRCAMLIQRIYLGYHVRKKFLKVWKLHKDRQALEHRSAIKIQLLIRRYVAKCKLFALIKRKTRIAKERKAKKLLLIATSSKSSLKWMLVLLYRKTKLFRIHMLQKKATIIQKVWRGKHGRTRAFIVRVTKAIKKIRDAYERRRAAAAKIQRNWRGFITRLKLLRRKRIKMATKIQTVWRLVRAKRRVSRLKKQNIDARILTRKLNRLCKKHKFHIKYIWRQQRTPYAVRIQALFRRALARTRVRRLLSAQRKIADTRLFITTRLNQLMAATQLQLVRDTLSVPIGQKSYSFSEESCTCLGPVQAIFTLGACNKGRTDSTALITNKADSITLLKMLLKVKGLMDKPEKADTAKDTGDHGGNRKKRQKRVNQIVANLCLFLEFDAGRIPLPAVYRKLKANHIDILFNRAKTEQGNLLSYTDFTDCLRLIAEAHYAKADISESLTTAVAATGLAEAVTGTSATATGMMAAGTDAAAGTATSAGSALSNKKIALATHNFAQSGQKRRVHGMSLARLKCNPQALFSGPEPDFRLALIVNIFASLRNEEWMIPVLEWIHRESSARIDVFVVRIQSVARRRFAQKFVAVLEKARAEQRLAMKLWHQAAKVQSLARMFLHRFRLARKAQRTIVQYNPHFGESYWYHPCTKVKSWTKPKVLRSLDAYTIALPEEGLENVVNCSYCSKQAEVNCCDCEDSMCRVCYDSMHCKGARAKHRSLKIPSCSYCKFQVATKACLTCIITPPAKGTIRESVQEADRGFYCDTCFIHEHDSNEKALNIHKQRRKGLKNILSYTSQAYLIDQYLHQRIITSHHYEDLVQSCEECCSRSSTWRCQDCNQVYCSSCLVGLHSMGGPFARHRAEQLPYFTPDMHISFKKDINKQLFQIKIDKLNRVEKARREEHRHACATKLQAWWRGVIYGYRGRKEMKRRRRRKRIAYKAHKRETLEKRNTTSYKIMHFLGRAPPLLSDTKEEDALRTLNEFQRQAARDFIHANLEDWGYYRVSRTEPRKGIPKRGFDWGTPEELTEQAIHGGYRLPGRVMIVPGEQIFATTCNLTRIIRPGEYVRIRNRIFGVVRVTATTIRVNRFWRAGLVEAKPDEEGELMFRAPLYQGEPRSAEYRVRYLAYTAAVENPIAQVGVRAYRYYAATMMRFSLYMVRSNRRNGMKEEEQAWRAASAQYADNIRYADSLFATGDRLTSLYGTVQVKFPPPAMAEDALSRSMKKKTYKGLAESMKVRQSAGRVGSGDDFDMGGLLDKDDSGSNDSWGEPAETVRPKSATQRGTSFKKLNRVVPEGGELVALPTGEEEGEEGGEAEDAPLLGEDDEESTKMGFTPLEEAGSVTGSDISGVSKKSSLLSMISNKFQNKEELAAIKAAADAMHELEKVDQPKAAGDVAAVLAEKKKSMEKKKRFEKPKEPWYATAEQLDERAEREDKMSPEELAMEADDWKECIDIMTENIYYQNVKTNELFTTVPRAVAAKRQLEFEQSKNKKNYDEAQKRIQKMELMIKNRKLITGGTHK